MRYQDGIKVLNLIEVKSNILDLVMVAKGGAKFQIIKQLSY